MKCTTNKLCARLYKYKIYFQCAREIAVFNAVFLTYFILAIRYV